MEPRGSDLKHPANRRLKPTPGKEACGGYIAHLAWAGLDRYPRQSTPIPWVKPPTPPDAGNAPAFPLRTGRNGVRRHRSCCGTAVAALLVLSASTSPAPVLDQQQPIFYIRSHPRSVAPAELWQVGPIFSRSVHR